MAEPVIVDDGGSTRIKQIKNTNMDDLLSNRGALADGRFERPQNPGVAACTLTVVHIEQDGTTNTVGPVNLAADSVVEIISANDQKLSVTLTRARRLNLDLTSSRDGGSDPIVEARHHGNQRRYIVSNAGPITEIWHTPDGGQRTPVFQPGEDTIYTMAHFS